MTNLRFSFMCPQFDTSVSDETCECQERLQIFMNYFCTVCSSRATSGQGGPLLRTPVQKFAASPKLPEIYWILHLVASRSLVWHRASSRRRASTRARVEPITAAAQRRLQLIC
eukprot:1916435-Pleurochrysis_carterae.AAC.2